jgi:hypothetical protein
VSILARHGGSTLPPRRPTLKKTLRTIESAFADLERSLTRLGKQAHKAARDAARNARRSGRKTGRWAGVLGKPRRRTKLTTKRRAQLKLQGQYMGYMRQLKPAQKARVKAVKEKKGFEAAIKMARKLASN